MPEPTGAGDAPPWLEPYPDHLLDHLADHATRPEARYDSTEAISLGFITALQLLPPRQRAALVLCDVVGYEAAEVADMLDTTRQAVDHALTHGRGVIDTRLADPAGTCIDSSRSGTGRTSRGDGGRRSARPPDATAEHPLAARFTHALEHADLDALIDLLHTDVKLSMPPAMLEYRGIESARRVFAGVTFRHGRTYRVVPTHANGQPAFGLYLADPHAGVHRAYALLVITTAGDLVTVVTAFTTAVMARFGLPRTLPGADWRIADTEP